MSRPSGGRSRVRRHTFFETEDQLQNNALYQSDDDSLANASFADDERPIDGNSSSSSDDEDYEDERKKRASAAAASGGEGTDRELEGDDDDAEEQPLVKKKKKRKKLKIEEERLYGFLYFLPKDDITIATHIVLFLGASVPAVLFIVFYSQMGIGEQDYYSLSEKYEKYAMKILYGILSLIVLLYVLDFSYWVRFGSTGILFIGFFTFAIFAAFVVFVLFSARSIPFGPICLVAMIAPLWMVLMQITVFKTLTFKMFATWCVTPFFLVSFCTGLSWVIWSLVHENNHWNEVNNAFYAPHAGCEPNFDSFPNCMDNATGSEVCFTAYNNGTIVYDDGCEKNCLKVYDGCVNTFLLWIGPALVSVVYVILSKLCYILQNKSVVLQISHTVKLWVFLIIAMWFSGSFMGAGNDLNVALEAFCFTVMLASLVIIGMSYSQELRMRTSESQSDDLIEEIIDYYEDYMDAFKGLLVVSCAPLWIVYMVMSFLNQTVRKMGCFLTKKLTDEDEDRGFITKRCRKQIDEIMTWDFTTVIVMAILWGGLFVSVQVFAQKIITLSFIELKALTAGNSIWVNTGIMIGAGLFMFLFPPVPGFPIYLMFGALVVKSGESIRNGYFIPTLYSIGVCLLIKLTACAIQQKIIGGFLSRFISVRKFCKINSPHARTIRLILSDPGLTTAKVAILVGGPDWPTYVLCGIWNLNLLTVLIGTLPVVILIVPSVLMGAFASFGAMTDENDDLKYPWALTCAVISVGAVGVVLYTMTNLAMLSVEAAVKKRSKEIKKLPMDLEVRQLEFEGERKDKVRERVTKWDLLPIWIKLVLLVSIAFMITACYIGLLFPKDCFESIYVDEEIVDIDWVDMVKPLGWVLAALFCISSGLLLIFFVWAEARTKKVMFKGDILHRKTMDEEGLKRFSSEVTDSMVDNDSNNS